MSFHSEQILLAFCEFSFGPDIIIITESTDYYYHRSPRSQADLTETTAMLNDDRVYLKDLTEKSRRAAAGRAELLATGQYTDRLQNPAKLRRFWIRGGDRGRIIRNFRKMLHFGKIPKKFGQIWRKFSKILATFAKFWKKRQKNQQFLTKILRLESGAKECIV